MIDAEHEAAEGHSARRPRVHAQVAGLGDFEGGAQNT